MWIQYALWALLTKKITSATDSAHMSVYSGYSGSPIVTGSTMGEVYQATIQSYPEYSGSIIARGKVAVGEEYEGSDSIRISYRLSGLEALTSGGLYIDQGFSCADHLLLMEHHYIVDTDPWDEVKWTSDSSGNAVGEIVLDSGYSASMNWGHAVVVHESDGTRCGCGLLGNEEIIAYMWDSSDYQGDLVEPRLRGVAALSKKMSSGLQFSFVVFGTKNTTDGGIYVYAGTTCSVSEAVGGQYYNRRLFTDRCAPVRSTHVERQFNKRLVAFGTYGIEYGHDSLKDKAGHTVIAYLNDGTRVACGFFGDGLSLQSASRFTIPSTIRTKVPSAGAWCDYLSVKSKILELSGSYIKKEGCDYKWNTYDGKKLYSSEEGHWVINSDSGFSLVYDKQGCTNIPPIGQSIWSVHIDAITIDICTAEVLVEINCYTPTNSPTENPTDSPSMSPSISPTRSPTETPSGDPSVSPTTAPTRTPTQTPTATPTQTPTLTPTQTPTLTPTYNPTGAPTIIPTPQPTNIPTQSPSNQPTNVPTALPTTVPTLSPTTLPTEYPSHTPSTLPTESPSHTPTTFPTEPPTRSPTGKPTYAPTQSPTSLPTATPTVSPTRSPTPHPTKNPTPVGVGGRNDENYCSSTRKCSIGQGDCDSDHHCASGLSCGSNNCRSFHPTALPTADCCYDKAGIGASDDMNYCTTSRKCSEGQGHCSNNNECAAGLTCGNKNCRNFHPNAATHTDCCYDKPGIGASDDMNYCTTSRKCSEGQGHCSNNNECAAGLTCGKRNCRNFHPNAAGHTDCCYDKPGIGAGDDAQYCTPTRKCSEGQGDCDSDNDCASGLTCGKDNCQKFHPNAQWNHDCCYDKPGIGAGDDAHYCTPTRKCSKGQGDCDSDNDCASGLTCGKDNCQKFHPNAQWNHDCCVRKINLSRKLSGYANSYDGDMTYYAGSKRMIVGFYSKHDNHKEDRIWRFYTGTASEVSCSEKGWTVWVNRYDYHLDFSCANNQALYGVHSKHDNHKEDRMWKFKCCDVGSFASMRYGDWTSYRNNWDDNLDYECEKLNEVIVGIKSDHDNHREDRRWYFRCAELLKKY